MTFELLTNATWFFALFFTVAAVTAAMLVGVAGRTVVVNHRARIARHESVRTYYGHRFALSH
ncbi:MAG: hypothetical protein V9G04_03760 [Nocardioides sp.]|jgi:hypothetical protein